MCICDIVFNAFLKDNFDKMLIAHHSAECLIGFEAWAKLAQQWLVCAPLGIHLEPINKQLMLLVII